MRKCIHFTPFVRNLLDITYRLITIRVLFFISSVRRAKSIMRGYSIEKHFLLNSCTSGVYFPLSLGSSFYWSVYFAAPLMGLWSSRCLHLTYIKTPKSPKTSALRVFKQPIRICKGSEYCYYTVVLNKLSQVIHRASLNLELYQNFS